MTEYDKAIAAFLTSGLGVLAAFNLNLPWFNTTVIAAVTPFITMAVVWAVRNVQPKPQPPSVGAVTPPATPPATPRLP